MDENPHKMKLTVLTGTSKCAAALQMLVSLTVKWSPPRHQIYQLILYFYIKTINDKLMASFNGSQGKISHLKG